jgi:8-oxo-dGTP pyrophosphatase MutT (NUDIX family)
VSHHNHFDYQEVLRKIEWEEGKLFEREIVGSYRHAVTFVCSSLGRTKGEFANGVYPYFSYGELLSPSGEWIQYGNNVVPILPDGRFLMVVEQRPILARYPEHPHIVGLQSKNRSFDIGMTGSLEFPGGAYNPGESFTMGILRELQEETAVEDQRAQLIRRSPGIYPFSADIALQMSFSIVHLTGLTFADYVEDDGGLRVIALTEKEVEQNMWHGVISSAQSALCGWAFYEEVQRAKMNGTFQSLVKMGYVVLDNVQIVKPLFFVT